LDKEIWDAFFDFFHFPELGIDSQKDGFFFCLIKDSELIFELIGLKGSILMKFMVGFRVVDLGVGADEKFKILLLIDA
jgi:hypothetical protein